MTRTDKTLKGKTSREFIAGLLIGLLIGWLTAWLPLYLIYIGEL